MAGRDEEFRRRLDARKTKSRKESASDALRRAAQQEIQRLAHELGPSARTPPTREEQERRRQATLASVSARRKKRAWGFRLAGVAAVAIASVAGVAGLLLVDTLNQPGWLLAPTSQTRPIPPQKISGLVPAAQAAGCQLRNYRSTALDHYHAAIGVRITYKTNPPSFGGHYPYPASDGDYVGIGAPRAPFLVHALEHGRIEIQYRVGVSQYHVDQLQELFNQPDGSYGPGAYLLLVANKSDMPYAVAAVAWGHVLGCPTINDRIFDAMRAFRRAFTLKATEHAIGPE